MQKEKENKNEIWRYEIESQLFQIKVMLIIMIDLIILGFYGLARAGWDDISGTMTGIAEIFLVVGFLATLFFLIAWISTRSSSVRNETNNNHKLQNTDETVTDK
ncbi:MAG: hypothetical protein P8016_09890 [Sedimentisphaerales bacterium]